MKAQGEQDRERERERNDYTRALQDGCLRVPWFDRKTSEVGAEQSRRVNYPHCAARRLAAAAAALGAITGLQGMASPGGRMMTAKRPINKRKRGSPEPEPDALPDAAPPELPPSSPTSSSTSEQSEQAMLDSKLHLLLLRHSTTPLPMLQPFCSLRSKCLA